MITNNLDAATPNQSRVVVVGTGPVGIAVALTLARKGIPVLVLESGTERFDAVQQHLSDAEIVSPAVHAPMELAVRRGLGGTSALWGGRCVPFDDIDFEHRPAVRQASWPISHDEIRPWYEAAISFFDCGTAEFTAPFRESSDPSTSCRTDQLERWSNQPNLGQRYTAEFHKQPNITLVLGATVVAIGVDDGTGIVRDVTVAGKDGAVKQVTGRTFVLACGGVETTRLLLLLQRERPSLFGGRDGPLGRHYMGHLIGTLADVLFTDNIDDRVFDFFFDESSHVCRRRIAVTADNQRELGLLNMGAWFDHPPFADPTHKSGALSLVYLALAMPGLGNKLVAEAIRRSHVGARPANIAPHMINVLRDLPRTVAFATNYLYGRYVDGRHVAASRFSGLFAHTKGWRHSLYYQGEPAPNRESRVLLSEQRDAFGVPRARIDLRFDRHDAASIVTSHKVIDKFLRDRGWGQLLYRQSENDQVQAVLDMASDGFHQIGTTRMSESANDGVVDRNCGCHDLVNLFIAGSSVFPTSGQANPTFLATALAVRTAYHVIELFDHLPTLS